MKDIIHKKKEVLFNYQENKKELLIDKYYKNNTVIREKTTQNNMLTYEKNYYKTIKDMLINQEIYVSEFEKKIIYMNADEFDESIYEDIEIERKLSKAYYKILMDIDIKRLDEDIKYRIDVYRNKQEILQRLMDKLVIIRTSIAHDLGYKDFNSLSCDRNKRIDFREEKLEKLKILVINTIVPLVEGIWRTLLKVKGINYINYTNCEEILNKLNDSLLIEKEKISEVYKIILEKIPGDIGELAKIIRKDKLYKVISDTNIGETSMCLFINEQKKPYIIYCFGKEKIHLPTIMHEFGHAYQLWKNKSKYKYVINNEPRQEFGEIHSLFMEIISVDYLVESKIWTLDKKRDYFIQAIIYIPYAMAIDELQIQIYKDGVLGEQRRNDLWINIIKKYRLYDIKSESNKFIYENSWLMDNEIFTTPNGLTNYAIAQIAALYLYYVCKRENKDMIKIYKNICEIGHILSYKEMFKKLMIKEPFDLEVLKDMCRFYGELISNNL